MEKDLRRTGIEAVGDLPWGTHFCHFYETKDDLLDTLVPYFKAGLEARELCVWVVSEPLTVEAASHSLRQAIPDLDGYLADGSIEILPHDEWYLKGGSFDFHRILRDWNTKLDQALARGYTGLRGNGNEDWLGEEVWADFAEYERQLDETINGQRMIVLCTYPLAKSGAAEILDVARTHQFALARRHGEWEVIETSELKQAKDEIKRLSDELERRVVERTRELALANEELRNEMAARRSVEEALRLSEQRFRETFDRAPFGMALRGPDGKWMRVNRAFGEMLGYSEQELLGMDFRSVVHPDDLEAKLEGLRHLLAGGIDSYHTQMRYLHKDGHAAWANLSATVVRDEAGHPLYLITQTRDITERKRAERRQAVLYAVTRVLAESTTMAGATPQVLQVICEGLGWEMGELWRVDLAASRIRHVEDWQAPSVEAAEFVAVSRQVALGPGVGLPGRVWQSGQPAWIPDVMADPSFSRRTMAAEFGLHAALGIPILLGGRALGAMLFLSREIRPPDEDLLKMMTAIGSQIGQFAERKRADDELRASRSRLQAILDNSPALIFLKDLEGRYLQVNRRFEQVFNLSGERILGRTDAEVFATGEPGARGPNDRKVLEAGRPLEFEETARYHDGLHTNIVYRFPLHDATGRVFAVGAIATDITERKRSEEERRRLLEDLTRQRAELRALAARLSETEESEKKRLTRELHDQVGQNLTALSVNLNVLRRQLPARTAMRVRRRLEDASSLLEETIARIRGVMAGLRPPLLDEKGLAAALRWHAEEFSSRTGLAVEVVVDAEFPRLTPTTESALFRIAAEALTNVAKHAQANRVTVSLEAPPELARMTIDDDGIGFDPAAPGPGPDGPTWGMIGMRERAESVGAVFRVESSPGQGTHITVEVGR